MPCGDFLPWIKRRRACGGEEEDQEEMHLQAKEQELITANNQADAVMSKAISYVTRSKSYSPSEDSEIRRYILLSLLTNSEEFQVGDSSCLTLLKCIYEDNAGNFREYLDRILKQEIESIEMSGQKLLHLLCFKKSVTYLEMLLSYEVDPNPFNADGVTPLHLAVSERWTEGVEALLRYGAYANILPEFRRSSSWPFDELPILTAARNGDFATSRVLLSEDPDLTLTDSEGNTVLHLACYSHCVELVKYLLENEAVVREISESNNMGNSPLHSLMIGNLMDDLPAYEEDIMECVKLLLAKGANTNHVNAANKTLLYFAASANLPLVTKILLNAGSDPLIKSIDGKTVLHAACDSRSHESLSLLLKNKSARSLILVEDNFHYVPFHIAVNRSSINCCELLLRNGDHLTRLDSKNRSRCSLVLKTMPSALHLLRRVLDSSIEISNNDYDDGDFQIKMDFSVLLPKSCEDVGASLISDFNDHDADALLKHPLVEAFLYLKWNRIRFFFYFYVFLFFIFLIIHTFYIVKTYGMNSNWEKEQMALNMVHGTHITTVIILLIFGTVTMFVNTRNFFLQYETYFKVIALTSAAFTVFSNKNTFQNTEIMRNVAAMSIFFNWVEFMMLLGRIPSLGIYILMFTRVSKSIVAFLLAFSPLLIAFTLCFGVLLNKIEVFSSFPIALVKTLMMMIGEIDYGDIYSETKNDKIVTIVVSQIFLVVYLFLITILMANLFISIAVNDLSNLEYHGKIRRLVKEASYIEAYERLLLVFREWTCMPHSVVNILSGRGGIKGEFMIYPNRINKMYRVKHITLPSDVIEEAIATGTKKVADKVKEDTENLVQKFYKEYTSNHDRLEKAIDRLYGIITGQGKNDGTDAPDSAFKSKRKNRSAN